MEKLLKLYGEFGLPLPPPNASLARIPAGASQVLDNGKEKPLYTLGFVLSPATPTAPAEILAGPCRAKAERSGEAGALQIIAAEKVDVREVTFDWDTTFPINLGPALAVQCFQRGHKELAEKLLQRCSSGLRVCGSGKRGAAEQHRAC